MFDLDGNGSIDSDEFREVVSLGNMAVSEEELDSLLQRGDLNSDGVIDLAEFKQLLKVSRVGSFLGGLAFSPGCVHCTLDY